MDVILHPPATIGFTGDLSEGDRDRISRALRDAVSRALANAATAEARHGEPSGPAADAPGEPFDPARLQRARTAYLIASYDDEGAPVAFTQATAPQVLDGPSPFEGVLVMYLPGMRYVHYRSPRYGVTGLLSHAVPLGLYIFGTTSFAVLSGPDPDGTVRHWVVGTDIVVSDADLGSPVAVDVQKLGGGELKTPHGEELSAVELRGIPVEDYTIGGRPYRMAAFNTYNGAGEKRSTVWWDVHAAAAYLKQVEKEKASTAAKVPVDVVQLVFGDLDALVAQIEAGSDAQLQKAAEKLSLLNRDAYALVGWETKVRYLKILIKAWTWQEQEKAVIEIFASLKSDSELDAVLDLLRAGDVYNQLFDDLDSELYSLLTEVGEKFSREKGPLTLDGYLKLLQAFGLLPRTMEQAVARVVFGPGGYVVPSEMIDEAHNAVMGFVRFGADLGEGIATIFTEPAKVVQGIGALVELLIKAELASVGYLPAAQELAALLTKVGTKVLAGMRGAERLGVGEKIMRRVKWRLVWEIASFFIGVGEVKAAIQAIGVSEKLAGILRFLAVLTRIGEVADAEVVAARLARLAALLKAERAVFASVEEVAELIGRLPDPDVRKLGRLLAKAEIREGEALADIARRSAELHAAVEDVLGKTELLKTLSAKSGGLTDAVVEAFHGLVGEKGLELADAQKVVRAIPDGEGARFAAAFKRVPLGRVPAASRGAFLELLAASPRRMDAMARIGFDAFASLYRRVAGGAERFDQYLGAIEELDRRLTGQGKPADFRRLLDGLERDDPAAWLRVEGARAGLAGEHATEEWLRMVSGSPRAQAGLDRLLRRDAAAMVRSLIDDLGGDAEVVLALEEIGRMGERELDGLLLLRRYVDRGGNFPDWNEILFTDPGRRQALLEALAGLRDPANPGALVIRNGLDAVLAAALQQRNVQGGIGHLQTVESLLRQFPGARFDLEVTSLAGGAWREIDIVMEVGGRRVSVEVKSYQVTTDLEHARRQISKDLVRHLGDGGGPWTDLLWRFPDPQYAANFPNVELLFLEELDKLAAQGRLTMPLPQAQAALRARFTAGRPWKLLDILP
jgi:hypothetical protein